MFQSQETQNLSICRQNIFWCYIQVLFHKLSNLIWFGDLPEDNDML